MKSDSAAEVSSKIAEYLLKIKAATFHLDSPITWTSGIKSPIYCDNRVLFSDHRMRTFIRKVLINVISEELGSIGSAVGISTGGIAPAALIAQELELSFAYIRPQPKGHGQRKILEGRLNELDRIVLIEDLISTAGSTIAAFDILKKNSYSVAGIVSIFSYDLPIASERLKRTLCPHFSLCSYETLIRTALTMGKINYEEYTKIQQWHDSLSEQNTRSN